MVGELIIGALMLLLLRMFVFKSRKEEIYGMFPGPRRYPFIGSLLEFNYPKEEVTETLKRLSFKYGPVYLFGMGMENVVCIRSPDDIEVILSSSIHIDKAPLYDVLMPWLNTGLLTSTGDKWRKQRKILTPAFHFKILEKFIPVFSKNSQILVDKLLNKVGKEMDVMPDVGLCSLDIISETAMGLEINAQLKDSEYVTALNEFQDIIAYRNFNAIQRSFLFPMMKVGRRHDQLVKYLHSVTENVMKERKAKLQESASNIKSENDDHDLGIKQKKVFLDLLLEYNKEGAGMTDSEIRDEVDTFMFEGYDTTSTTIAFCLYCLSQNPLVQEKLYEELMHVLGDDERDPTHQQLQDLKYLEKVIKETLRCYATVQFIARTAKRDLQLNSGYIVPKDTSVLILIEAMNHDPRLYPDPYKFDPDRFDIKTSNPYTFVPFSAGPRNCIGQRYAMLETKVVVSQIVRKLRLLPSAVPITRTFKIVIKSKTGVHLQFEPRNIP